MKSKFSGFLLFFLVSAFTIKANSLEGQERFDKSLGRLDSIDRLIAYIDSCAEAKNTERGAKEEAFLVNHVIEQKFYHGYSHYSLQENLLAYLAGKGWDHLSAIVIPEDIVKHEMAACSQQAIVMMEVLKYKGFPVRKLGLQGHFVLEAYYDNDWHVFDPNKEIAHRGFSHDSLSVFLETGYLSEIYKGKLSSEDVNSIFSKMETGEINEFAAKKARVFHQVTGFISEYFTLISLTSVLAIMIIVKILNKKALTIEDGNKDFSTWSFK